MNAYSVNVQLLNDDCLTALKTIDNNSIDSVVTDPPYGLGFMGKEWDIFDKTQFGQAGLEGENDLKAKKNFNVLPRFGAGKGLQDFTYLWVKECLRVLKPGGHLLSFGGTRTYHRMACAIEDAGFEIKNMICWAYGQGFPKSTRINANPKFCQCVLTGRNGGNTNPSQRQGDHNNKVLAEHDDDRSQQGVGHLKNEGVDSRGDCQQDCDLNDGQLLGVLSHDQEPSPLQEYAQEHNHSSSPDDVQVSESLHNPSGVQHNDRPSNQDCSRHDLSVTAKPKNISVNNKHADASKSLNRKQGNVSYKSSFSNKYNIGFPLCQVCGKPNADGWGTDLKPSIEPICFAKKPISEKNIAENCLKWGTGGINIDESRVEYSETNKPIPQLAQNKRDIKTNEGMYGGNSFNESKTKSTIGGSLEGRFPANLIHDNSEEVRECFPETKSGIMKQHIEGGQYNVYGKMYPRDVETIGDSGNASRFFKSIIYQPKASKAERNKGCEGLEEKQYSHDGREKPIENAFQRNKSVAANNHPTIKPIALMEYLIKMVTPKGGTVLDPFAGSFSTGVACINLDRSFIGIEKEKNYFKIGKARMDYAIKKREYTLF